MRLVRAERERVPVRLRARDRECADHPGAAAAGIDHDRLPERACRFLRDEPRDEIDRPSGRIRHDDGDGARWKGLTPSRITTQC